MLDTFKGDPAARAGAYNAGEQHVVRHRGIHPSRRRAASWRACSARWRQERRGGVLASRSRPAVGLAHPAPAAEGLHGERSSARPTPRARPWSVPASRTWERPSQLVLHDLEQRPSARTWSPMPGPCIRWSAAAHADPTGPTARLPSSPVASPRSSPLLPASCATMAAPGAATSARKERACDSASSTSTSYRAPGRTAASNVSPGRARAGRAGRPARHRLRLEVEHTS